MLAISVERESTLRTLSPLVTIGWGGGESNLPGREKAGPINPNFENFSIGPLHQPSLVFPHPLVFLVADKLPLARPSGLALEHEVQELLGDAEELRSLGGCAEGGL